MYCEEYALGLRRILDDIINYQGDRISSAGAMCASSIASGALVHLFGTGHSSLAVVEMAARTGSPVGFHPIIEPSLMWFTDVPSHRLTTFFEQVEGLGRAIMLNQTLDQQDVVVLVSHSGINPVIVDAALAVKEFAVSLIAILSLKHSLCHRSRHSSGRTLADIADVVIDTGAPLGDALISIDDSGLSTGPASSIAALFIMNMLRCDVIDRLIAMGRAVTVMPSPNIDSEETVASLARFYAQYQQSLLRR